jgi:hypothetical protein
MGRFVDLDRPLSDADKKYLESRGRGYLIFANERKFGVDGKKEPVGVQKYDLEVRGQAVYDQGGAPLPGTTLDYNTGRVYGGANADVLVEPNLPHNSPGHFSNRIEPEGFASTPDDGEVDIDDDIVEEVLKLHVAGLKGRLTTMNVEVDPDDKKADLQNKLAIALQDERDAQKKK